MKQRILTFTLAILCLSSLACKGAAPQAPSEPKETPVILAADPTSMPDHIPFVKFDFNDEIDPDTLYIITADVLQMEADGFVALTSVSSTDGQDLDKVFVHDSSTTHTYQEQDRVMVIFYGRDFSALESPGEVIDEDGCVHSYQYEISNVITVIRYWEGEADTIYDSGDNNSISHSYKKPILYFYPEEETIISAKLELNGRLTCTYPEHGKDGWQNFVAKPDGTLIGPDGKEYYALYWEGETDTIYNFSKGFCVEGSRTAEFLADILPKLGLSAREANEFIIYWLPQMQNNAYNLISFQKDAYTDSAKLTLSPEPDTLIRVFMAWKGLETPVEIEPQTIVTPERIGFTVVEWGGSEVNTH